MKNNKPTDYTYHSHLNKALLMKYNTTEVQATVSYFSDALIFMHKRTAYMRKLKKNTPCMWSCFEMVLQE